MFSQQLQIIAFELLQILSDPLLQIYDNCFKVSCDLLNRFVGKIEVLPACVTMEIDVCVEHRRAAA